MKHSRSSALSAYREFEIKKEDEQQIKCYLNEENSTQLSDVIQYPNDISPNIFSEIIQRIKKSHNIIQSAKENHKHLLRKKILSLVLNKNAKGVSEKILSKRFSEDKSKKKIFRLKKAATNKLSVQASPRTVKESKQFSATLHGKELPRTSAFSLR